MPATMIACSSVMETKVYRSANLAAMARCSACFPRLACESGMKLNVPETTTVGDDAGVVWVGCVE